MKMNIRTIALIAAAIVASASQMAQAQTGITATRATVPFAFTCGSAQMRAGTYTVNVDGSSLIVVRGAARGTLAAIDRTIDSKASKSTRLVFVKYGERYFLDQVFTQGSEEHLAVRRSREMTRAAQELTARGEQATLVELVVGKATGE